MNKNRSSLVSYERQITYSIRTNKQTEDRRQNPMNIKTRNDAVHIFLIYIMLFPVQIKYD